LDIVALALFCASEIPSPASHTTDSSCPYFSLLRSFWLAIHLYEMKLTRQWLVPCILALTSVTYSHHIGNSPSNTESFEQPLGLLTTSTDTSPLLALHRALVEVESITGNEYAVGEYLEAYLQSQNFTVERQNVDPLHMSGVASETGSLKKKQRFNLLAYPGSRRQTPLLLSTHIDTVPPYIPYTIDSSDEIWGRGTVDAKACVATQIHAALELLAAGEIRAEHVSFLFVVGEVCNFPSLFLLLCIGECVSALEQQC